MNIFRSGDHIDRWLAGRNPGATITIDKLCGLAHAWWGDRLESTWHPHTSASNQGILDTLGLTTDFWRLA
jgi:hypothetical protein